MFALPPGSLYYSYMLTQPTKALLWLVKIGLWLVPVLPFYVSPSLLFPFVTGKNFAFRILIEVLCVAWTGLVVSQPAYRSKPGPLVQALTVCVGLVFVADLCAPNPYRALFSNYERMEGFMMLGHLYLLYLMLATVLQTRRDWMVFWHMSLGVSVAVSLVGVLQKYCQDMVVHHDVCLAWSQWLQYLNVPLSAAPGEFRIYGTIGHPSHFAAYLLFHLWLALWLLHAYWHQWWRVGLYSAVLLFELWMLYLTATRGVIMALMLTVVLLLVVVVCQWQRVAPRAPALRRLAIAALLLAVATPLCFWSMRHMAWVQENAILQRLTNFSLRTATMQDRVLIWGMAWQGVLERPLLGWGQEQYYLVFQKYFHPRLFGAEPSFDRAHNVVLDWLVHAGCLGLASYLALLSVLCRSVLRGMQQKRVAYWPGLLLLSLFASYVLQNLFVFDTVNTYLLFCAWLAYVQYLTSDQTAASPAGQRANGTRVARQAGMATHAYAYGASAVLLGIIAVWGYYTHLKPLQAGHALRRALQVTAAPASSADDIQEAFTQALQYHSFGDTEIREQLINAVRQLVGSRRLTPEAQKRLVDFGLTEMHKQTETEAKDSKHLLLYSLVIDHLLAMTAQENSPFQQIIDAEAARTYIQRSEAALHEALRLAPRKQAVLMELSQLYALTGRAEQAVEILKRAWDLERNFQAAAETLLVRAALTKNQPLVHEITAMYPIATLSLANLARLGIAYRQVTDFAAALPVYAQLVVAEPTHAPYRATYAGLLAQVGRYAEARVQALEASKLDPSLQEQVERFLAVIDQTSQK